MNSIAWTPMLLFLLAFGGWSFAAPGSDPLSSGVERFFRGDLDGAVSDWGAAHEAGQRAGRELARLGLRILAKDALQSGNALSARVHIAHGLELSPGDKELEALFKLAETDSPFKAAPAPRSVDSSAERESLIQRVLEIDLQRRDKPKAENDPHPQPLIRELFSKREKEKFDVDQLLASLAKAESAAAARAQVSVAWHKKRARYRYEQGLGAYYAGDYAAAADHFRQALRLDSRLTTAQTGLVSCEALLRAPGGASKGGPALPPPPGRGGRDTSPSPSRKARKGG